MTDTKESKERGTIKNEMEGVRQELDRLRGNLDRASFNGNSTINVNAGGVGLWIAVTCCMVSLVASLFLSLLVMDQRREIDDLNHHLTAIYMQAPHLKKDK